MNTLATVISLIILSPIIVGWAVGSPEALAAIRE